MKNVLAKKEKVTELDVLLIAPCTSTRKTRHKVRYSELLAL